MKRALLVVSALAQFSCEATVTDPNGNDVKRCDELYTKFRPTSDPSFRDDVVPMLQESCALGQCHGGSTGIQGELWLGPNEDDLGDEQLDLIYRSLIDVQSIAAPEIALVREGRPRDSFLMLKIDGCQNHPLLTCALDDDEKGGPCGEEMPVQLPPLPERDRALIRSWIAQGAKFN